MNTEDQLTVVAGMESSREGDNAVRWALEYARARRLPLCLAEMADDRRRPPGEVLAPAGTEFASTVLLCRSTAPELPITGAPRTADSVESLLASAHEVGMLVMKPTGHRLSAALSGEIGCPVAFINTARWPNPAASVVAGVSGGEQDDEVLALAFDMAGHCAAPLVAVHSWHDTQNQPGDPQIDAKAFLDRMLTRWRVEFPKVRVSVRVAGGPPAVVLPALTHAAGLLVIGAGTSGVAALAVRYAHCPVLVVQ